LDLWIFNLRASNPLITQPFHVTGILRKGISDLLSSSFFYYSNRRRLACFSFCALYLPPMPKFIIHVYIAMGVPALDKAGSYGIEGIDWQPVGKLEFLVLPLASSFLRRLTDWF
jgi:hypothetical protein